MQRYGIRISLRVMRRAQGRELRLHLAHSARIKRDIDCRCGNIVANSAHLALTALNHKFSLGRETKEIRRLSKMMIGPSTMFSSRIESHVQQDASANVPTSLAV